MGHARSLALLALALVALYQTAPLLLGALGAVRSAASAGPAPKDVRTQPQKYRHRIVAIGDLHGDLPHAMRCLRLAGVVDLRGKWIAKGTTVVQTGDLVDRGDDTIALYRLMDRLREEAPRAGSRLVNLLGNHEYMNSLHDWRYVTKGDIATFGGERARRLAMSARGWIGRTWQANYSTTARVPYALSFPLLAPSSLAPNAPSAGPLHQLLNSPPNPQQPFLPAGDEVTTFFASAAASFVHGGITPAYAELGLTEINRLGLSFLNRSLNDATSPSRLPHGTPEDEARFYGADGPLWYRGYALDDEDEDLCDRAEAAAQALGVRRLVMGHTPVFKGIVSRCQGKILLIDTGISSAYGGALSALEIVYTLAPALPLAPEPSAGGRLKTPHVKPGETIRWVEREIVSALHEGLPKKTLARRERSIELVWKG